jgi:Lrp/AsnC family transcriptional regulator for asnA, asnC and gidA
MNKKQNEIAEAGSNYEIDNLDRQILAHLIADAKEPFTEIAKKLIVSPGTIHVRMKKMEQMGVIKGATLILDPAKLGYDLIAFIGIFLAKGSLYHEVIRELNAIPEIVEAHYTTGTYSIFAKMICRNTSHLRDIISERLQAIGGVIRTETIISLEESIRKQVPV